MSTVASHSDFSRGLPITFVRRWFAVLARMVWKEFRVLLPFLTAVAGTMAGLAALVIWALRDQQAEVVGGLSVIVVLFPLLFALGCGGMAYAGEREDGTWDWLRRIAAPPSAVCAAKIFVGLLSALTLATVAWFALARFAGRLEPTNRLFDPTPWRLAILLIGVSTALLLSQLVSSVIKHVFVALIAAGILAAPVLTVGLALVTDHAGNIFGSGTMPVHVAEALLGWIIVLPGLILCEFSLADCWLKDVPPWRGGLIGLLVNPANRQRLLLSAWGYRQSPLAHLMSREWSLARPWLWSFVLTLVVPIWQAVNNDSITYHRRGLFRFDDGSVLQALSLFVMSPLLVIATALLVLTPALLGVWAYQPDQRELRFRFLADRGVSPTLVWLSKHLVRIPILLLLVLTASFMGLLSGLRYSARLDAEPVFWALWVCSVFVVASYSGGQLIGQLIRSPITSSFLASALAGLLIFWMWCLQQLRVLFVFDLIPIAILFTAGWLRSPDWLLERTTWRARLRLAASVLIPFALLYGAVGWYRLSGFPRVARKPPTIAETEKFPKQRSDGRQEFERRRKAIEDIYGAELAVWNAEDAERKFVDPSTNRPRESRHFRRTRDRLLEFSRSLRLGELPNDWLTQRIRVPYRELEQRADELIAQQSYAEALPLLWAAECLERHFWWFTEHDPTTNSNRRSSDHRPLMYRFLSAAALCRKSEPLRPFIQEANQSRESFEVLKGLLQWHWAAILDSSDDTRLITGQAHETLLFWPQPATPAAPLLMRLFPWELTVVRREASFDLARQLTVWEAIDDVIHDRAVDRISWQPGQLQPATQSGHERFFPAVAEFERPIQPFGLLTTISSPESQSIELSPASRSRAITRELERRQVVLLLALIAWHHDHGDLPESLDSLVGPYLDKLPIDPLTGKPFVYQKSPQVSVLPPCVLEQRHPQLRVRSLDGTHDVWLELRAEMRPYQLTNELFRNPESEK